MFPACFAEDMIFLIMFQKTRIKTKKSLQTEFFLSKKWNVSAACATAPMLQINNKEFHEKLTLEEVDTLLENLRNSN